VPAEPALRTARALQAEVHAPDERFVREYPAADTLTAGRDAECPLHLPSPVVSRRHFSVKLAGEALLVTDHSANGTSIDGELVLGRSLQCGTRATLQCGPYVVRLRVLGLASGERAAAPRPRSAGEVPTALRRLFREQLLEHLERTRAGSERTPDAVLRARVDDALWALAAQHEAALPEAGERDAFVALLRDEVLGLGPLEPLLRDAACSEIMVVDPSTIFAERSGRLERTDARFTDESAVRAAIERIVTPLGRRIDESSPIVDARLPDGSRVHAVIPPIALRGPCITIRKFPARQFTLDELVARGSLNTAMAELLAQAVAAKLNVVISGGTGSGKTTLLNALSAAIPSSERIVTIEDAAELKLMQSHVVALEARPASGQGGPGIGIRELVKASLRMRPDRIVVGECRGGEALDMLQAMNTGHEGSMTTTHANTAREAVQRLETLCLMAGVELPLSAIRRQIAASVHLVVQQMRLADGARRITEISEVVGLDEHGEVELRPLYELDRSEAARTVFRRTGVVPGFAARLRAVRAQVAHG
jgi:pilus assembly protein CpaF